MAIPFTKQKVTFTFYDENDLLFGLYTVDASMEETHKAGVEITRHPVARGLALTDQVRPKPDAVTIVAFFSNLGTNLLETVEKLTTPSAEDNYNAIKAIMKKGLRCTLKTTLDTYENMLIEDMSVPRSAGRGRHVEATISLVEFKTAVSITVETAAKPKKTGDGPTKAKGSQAPQPANEAKNASVIAKTTDVKKAVGKVIGFLKKG